MSWIDWVIIAIVAIGVWQGWWRGFISQAFQLGGLILATFLSIWWSPYAGNFFEREFQIPITLARPVAILAIFFVLWFFLNLVTGILQKLFAPILIASLPNKIAGSLLGAFQKILIISIILGLMVALPFPDSIKDTINKAKLAHPLIRFSLIANKILGGGLDQSTLNSLGARLVGSQDTTTQALNFTVANALADESTEAGLLTLTNTSRLSEGLPPVASNDKLRDAARAHAADMLARGYFSHLSPPPGSKDPLGRLQAAGITVLSVGENLAVAPNAEIAQNALLASQGHKANILNKDFNQVGIGVLDAGTHGKMIVEMFAQIP